MRRLLIQPQKLRQGVTNDNPHVIELAAHIRPKVSFPAQA